MEKIYVRGRFSRWKRKDFSAMTKNQMVVKHLEAGCHLAYSDWINHARRSCVNTEKQMLFILVIFVLVFSLSFGKRDKTHYL